MDLCLTEHGESAPVRLDGDARSALLATARDKIEIQATADPERVTLRTTSWVGVLSLPGHTIRVMPSAPMENLFTMFTAGLPGEGWSRDQVGWSRETSLVDGVAEFLLRSIDEATRRGLLHGYVTREEDLNVLRGRLLVDQLATRPWAAARPPCRFDDFTVDVPENRLLLCGVRQVLGWPDLPPLVRRDGLRLIDRFQGVTAVPPGSPEFDIPVTRLNEHYASTMDLVRRALEGITIRHLDGEQQAHAFMVDMDDLFRRWVTIELTQRLWPDISIDEQPLHALDVHDQLHFTPDLLMRSGPTPVLVGDITYHLVSKGTESSGDGIYPLLTYASALGLDAGLLVYAQADEPPATELVVRSIGTRLLCVPLRLSVPPARLAGSLDTIAELIRVVAIGALAGPR